MSRDQKVTKLAVVDIETLDKAPAAVVFSIGCVVVDIDQLAVTSEYYGLCNPQQEGRTKDLGTIDFWFKQMEQSPGAFEQLQVAHSSKMRLEQLLANFANYLALEFGDEPINIFGNGPEFDNVILDNAFEWAGLSTPWPYWGNQSIRTANLFMRIAGCTEKRKFEGIKHHALDDAHNEAEQLINGLRMLESVDKPSVKPGGSDLQAVSEDFGKVSYASAQEALLSASLNILEHKNKKFIESKEGSKEPIDLESLNQRATAFDELHRMLLSIKPECFNKSGTRLADDCKHAIGLLKEKADLWDDTNKAGKANKE